MRNPLNVYHKIKIRDLGSLAFGNQFWGKYLQDTYFPGSNNVLEKFGDMEVIVDSLDFMKGLDELVKKTPVHHLKFYILWY